MNSTPYFSIVVPMYNVERYVKVCIDSILAQTFQNFEVIIVDDASSDNSYKICQKFFGGNKKVRLFHFEKNSGGPSPARNFGLKESRGKYIWFVDSDDATVPNALEKLYKAIQNSKDEIDAVHLKGRLITNQDDDKPIDTTNLNLSWEDNPAVGFLTEDIPRRLLNTWVRIKIAGTTWNTIYRRKFLLENDINFPEDCYSEDNVLSLMALCLAKKYLILKDFICIYRVRSESYSHNVDIKMCIASMPNVEVRLKKFFDKVPSLDGNRNLQEWCIAKIFEAHLRDHALPLYRNGNIGAKLDQDVYDALSPIFGEHTMLVKYLFHGFNDMWLRKISLTGQQNYLLKEKGELIQRQEKMIEQLSKYLEQQRRQLEQLKDN